MTNTPRTTMHSGTHNPVVIKAAPYRRLGHLDAQGDCPFHPNYDKWTEFQQIAYERGRLIGKMLQMGGLDDMPWPRGVVRPTGYDAAVLFISKRHGNPMPSRTPLPPSDTYACAA
jgi:hypothetical protein